MVHNKILCIFATDKQNNNNLERCGTPKKRQKIMTRSIVTFKKNGNIEILGTKVGVWEYENVWENQGKKDKCGNHLVRGLWHAYTIDGQKITDYTRNEVKKTILMLGNGLMKAARIMSDEQKQTNINNAE